MGTKVAVRPGADKVSPRKSSRDLLLDATGALMSESNTTRVSFSDISARSGVNAGLIRYHFGNKPGLLHALLERDAGHTIDMLGKLVAADLPAVEKLKHHIHGIIKTYHRYPYMNRLVASLQSEGVTESAQFIFERFTAPIVEAQASILQQGIREGVFKDCDPMMFHFAVIGACDQLFQGRSVLNHVFKVDTIDFELRDNYADFILGTLLRGIQTGSDERG